MTRWDYILAGVIAFTVTLIVVGVILIGDPG